MNTAQLSMAIMIGLTTGGNPAMAQVRPPTRLMLTFYK